MTPVLSAKRADASAPAAANRKQTVILLGPQGRKETLAGVLKEHGITGPLAVVTAGWQEAEDEVEPMEAHLGEPTRNLQLHRRGDEVFAADPALSDAHQLRQKRLREQQRLYNVRVDHAATAVLELSRRRGQSDLAEEAFVDAMDGVRDVDAWHLRRIQAIHDEFEPKLKLDRRKGVKKHRKEVEAILKDCAALAVAGGHVAVLLNRLRLFGIADLVKGMPVVAWSGGAMVLTERVVLFHDRPPQGFGNAEVLESGLGLVRNVVALPHARERIRLEDPARVARFAHRFGPARCVALDEGGRVTVGPSGWSASPETRVLAESGLLEEMS